MTPARTIRSIIEPCKRSGLVPNMPRLDYRTIPRLNPSALSAGLVGVREIDPRAIRDAFQAGDRARTGAAQDRMDRGTLAHMALLQPERLMSDVAVWCGGARRGGEWARFEGEHAGKLVLKVEDYESTMATVNQLRSLKLAADLLRDVSPEVAVFVTEHSAGLAIHCKGQVDAVNVPRRRIVDVKTTEAGIDERSVMNTIRSFHYREKMAAYRRWVAMSTETDMAQWECWNLFLGLGEDRLGIRAMKFTESALELGWFRMEQAIERVAKCLQADDWPMFEVSDVIDVAAWECVEEGEVHIE